MRLAWARSWRTCVARGLPVLGAVATAAIAEFSTDAMADVFRFQPFVIVDQIFTDNVEFRADDRDADGVTVLTARIEALVTTSRINAAATADVYYSEFWGADEFDSINGRGLGAARVELIDGLMFVDGIAERRHVFLTPTSQSASNLEIGQNQAQQTSYTVSPLLTLEVFGMADLLVRGSFAQVKYDDPIVGPALVLLNDVTTKSLAARISTGGRSSLYELAASAEHFETDNGFEQRNAIGSVFLHLFGGFSAIGRVGYERITDPSFPEIGGTIWSAGGQYRVGDRTVARIEYGKRFGDTSWFGQVSIPVTPRVSIEGSYLDTLRPPQLTLTRSLEDLFNEDGTIDLISAQNPDVPDPTIIDEIVRDKNFEISAVYATELESYRLSTRFVERQFPALLDSEELFAVDFEIIERLSRRLSYSVRLSYQDTRQSITGASSRETYLSELDFRYAYNESVSFSGGYAWQLEAAPNDVDAYENVLSFSAQHAF